MSAATFKGGVHPQYNKDTTSKLATEICPVPGEIVIPLSQHIGAPAKACVKKGDEVKKGQVIAEPVGFVSTFIHSTVSGTVKAVENRPAMLNAFMNCVVIENDGEETCVEYNGLGDDWAAKDNKDLLDMIHKAGLVGMGGAAFPTNVKLSPPAEKPIDTVLLNGAECEPFLTADHRIMIERPQDIVTGLQISMKILGAKRGIIGIEENKPDAIEEMQKAASGTEIEVMSLEVKYPQGGEKQLIDACIKREIPSGGLPMDAGVVVHNVSTAAAMTDAVVHGKPFIERIVTITGTPVKKPSNLLVRLGTTVDNVLEACGGTQGEVGKLLSGGPMMGLALHGENVPVIKSTGGLLLLAKDEIDYDKPDPCIRCGRCARACPMRLVPTELAALGQRRMVDSPATADAFDCMECGSCSYVCPSRIPVVQWIRMLKALMNAKRQKK